MKETTRNTNTCLPYGMALTLIFEATHIDLSGEDIRQLHHTDTYSTKSLNRMRYHLLNGQWRNKIFGQRADTSSSEDEEKDELSLCPYHLGLPVPLFPVLVSHCISLAAATTKLLLLHLVTSKQVKKNDKDDNDDEDEVDEDEAKEEDVVQDRQRQERGRRKKKCVLAGA